jgi:diguanylate cyclase (GGDEF)-like protein/PAS domain S-box-containing protein
MGTESDTSERGFLRVLVQSPAAFLILALGLVISFSAWRYTAQQVQAEAEIAFQREVAQATGILDRRIRDNVNLLIGLKGLFDASEEVTGQKFRRYLSGFDLSQRYTGVRVVSYSRRVLSADKLAFERAMQRRTSLDPRGNPDFAIKPPGERDEYAVAIYLEPAEGNQAAFGLDLMADPVRRAEIERARDTGTAVASGPFMATVAPDSISIAVRAAVYRNDAATDTVAQRREAYAGVVAVVIQVDKLITGLLDRQIGSAFDLAVYDLGPSHAVPLPAAEQQLLFDSRRLLGTSVAPAGPHALRQTMLLEVAARNWRLEYSGPEATALGTAGALPGLVLTVGVGTSLLLFWLIWALSASRARALELAKQATAVRAAEGLREQLDFIQQLIEAVPQPIFFKDIEGRYLGVNKAWERFFGISRRQFIGKSVFELYPENQALAQRHHAKDQELFSSPGSQSYEAAILAADGKLHHTIYNKATFNKSGGAVAGLIGTITDVNQLKDTESALRESEARFRDLTELSSDWYWEQDENLRFTQVSAKIREFNLETQIGKTRWEVDSVGVTDEQWRAHRQALARHEPFQNFIYQRHDNSGNLRTISVNGRPIFDEQGRFRGYRGTGRDITEQRQAEERIQHMAHHDALTGLPNRALLNDRLGQAIALAQRNRELLALLFIDLDRFKTVNDSLGHPTGDSLLCAVADRLVACVRATDTVARLGGDEFVVLLTDIKQAVDSAQVAQKAVESLSQPFRVGKHVLHITPSIGICTFPHDGHDVDTLMRNADAAMYHAKEMGRNNYQFFTQSMNLITHERLELENDLRHALERGEMSLHYQPQIDLKTGAIVGFEALARWEHPQRGSVPPSEFIHVAEEAGLIHPIGEFVLGEACKQARIWHAAGFPRLQVAVNCSAKQFRRKGMVEAVAKLLQELGLSADSLELEITESVMLQHPEQVIDWFKELTQMGLQLSLDDFGTGYSSLSYLKRFPIQKLKIDQSFVCNISHDPDDAAIVRAILAMAHSLGLEVIAEGVETAEQLAFLKSLGCDKAQGFYFSKPLPAGQFLELLRKWNPAAKGVSA